MTTIAPIFDHSNWRRRLAGEALPVHEGCPEVGYWRKREKDRSGKFIGWRAVAMWEHYGEITGQIQNLDGTLSNLNAKGCVDVWTWVVKYPVTEAQYLAVTEDGKSWHDEVRVTIPASGSDFGAEPEAPQEEVAPKPLDETLRIEIAATIKASEPYDTIASDEDATKALTLRNMLNELALKGEKEYERGIAPLNVNALAAKKILDMAKEKVAEFKNRWAFTDTARDRGKKLRVLVEAYKSRKANEAAAAAAAAEAAAAAPAPTEPGIGHNSDTTTTLAIDPAPPQPELVQPTQGRKVSSLTYDKVVIDDIDEVFAFFRGNPEVTECLTMLAQRSADGGIVAPGTHTEKATRIK
jgi:hypothetical protein